MLIGAIEAGGTKMILALAGKDGTILARQRIATRDPAETLADIRDWFAAQGAISALGVASFGPLDTNPASPAYGTITTTPKPGWSGFSWREALAPLNVPVTIDSDVNGAALGEWKAGAGAGKSCVAYTTVGTGIGAGVISDGRTLGGIGHLEAGHIRPARPTGDDWPGHCPYHGDCLEGLASGPAIAARWGHNLSSASVEEVELVASYLAEYAMTLALTHMPEVMIFGGGVSKARGLIEAIRRLTREKLAGYIPAYDRDLTGIICLPQLGDDAGITGALILASRALD
ncbi:ROK family protein [Alteraurantiacibacter aquimixticola]|nr:ROK family protein [Alteraurantiacibacter aquimixticola]